MKKVNERKLTDFSGKDITSFLYYYVRKHASTDTKSTGCLTTTNSQRRNEPRTIQDAYIGALPGVPSPTRYSPSSHMKQRHEIMLGTGSRLHREIRF